MINIRLLTTSALLAVAVAFYALTGPDEGMLSGPGAVSHLLNSLPIVSL